MQQWATVARRRFLTGLQRLLELVLACERHFTQLTTREAAWYIISSAYVQPIVHSVLAFAACFMTIKECNEISGNQNVMG